MKKLFCIILIVSAAAIVLSSCERRCICEYEADGSKEVMYNAYSKKECNEWEDYLTNDLNTKVSCTYKRFK